MTLNYMIDLTQVPAEIKAVMNIFKEANYEIYIVGGAVRDLLLEKQPHDYDLTTNALPEQMIELCEKQNLKYIPTGLKHGTITILYEEYPIEVTTFRIDGEYSDNRHPDKVEFTSSLKEDLARRDLTINALALDLSGRIYDYFGGIKDLFDGPRIKIDTVGNPEERFNEDGLRILRAYRFAAQLDGEIVIPKYIIDRNLHLIRNISNERIRDELDKYLLGNNINEYFEDFIKLVAVKVPKLMNLFMIQNNKWHTYQVLTQHTSHVITLCQNDLVTRLAALFHDIGKKTCYTEEIIDGQINGHFYEHPAASASIAEDCLKTLKYPNDTIKQVVCLILYHDAEIAYSKKSVKKILNNINNFITSENIDKYELFKKLIDLKDADRRTHNQKLLIDSKLKPIFINEYLDILEEIKDEQECFSLKDLAINGNDLIELEYKQGPKFKVILEDCLTNVLDEKLENKKEILVKYILENYSKN